MTECQPIETAPKDGTYVLCAHKGGHINILQFTNIGGGYWRNEHGRWSPTHWMPLPEPPQ